MLGAMINLWEKKALLAVELGKGPPTLELKRRVKQG